MVVYFVWFLAFCLPFQVLHLKVVDDLRLRSTCCSWTQIVHDFSQNLLMSKVVGSFIVWNLPAMLPTTLFPRSFESL